MEFRWHKEIRDLYLAMVDPEAYVRRTLPASETISAPDRYLAQLKLKIHQRKIFVRDGLQMTAHRGRGLEFMGLREYAEGDDVRRIDWNVFARTHTPHVREYHHDQDRALWFVLDCTPSMYFGRTIPKLRTAIELLGVLGIFAVRASERVGLYAFNGRNEIVHPPRSGERHFQQILHSVLQLFENSGEGRKEYGAPLGQAFDELMKLRTKQAVMFVISDFLDDLPSWIERFRRLAWKHTLYSFPVSDIREWELPGERGWFRLSDNQTDLTRSISYSSEAELKELNDALKVFHVNRHKQLGRYSRVVPIRTENDLFSTIAEEFFKQRFHNDARNRRIHL